MKNKRAGLLTVIICYSLVLTAQVQVSKEPRHKKVLENKYLRFLDVHIEPGDTSLFHIHSTPSVFVYFTNSFVCSQIKGQKWVTGNNTKGNASFRSFLNDTVVHRVSNCDTVPFHVSDVELLSPYRPGTKLQPLPFTLLFENENVFAYRVTTTDKTIITDRGPMIAELVAGNDVLIRNKKGKKVSTLKAGKHAYIKPGTEFYFSAATDAAINMVLFEIK